MVSGDIKWFNENKGYGFAETKEGLKVLIHISNIESTSRKDIKVGEQIKFNIVKTEKGFKGTNIQKEKKEMNVISPDNSFPGLRKGIKLEHFTDNERKIIERMGKEFYVTNGGGEISIAKSKYRYLLVKPVGVYQELFNARREIIVVFSPYDQYEPRTLDAIDNIAKKYQRFRLDRICTIVISGDEDIEDKLKDDLKRDTEIQIVIPFSYQDLLVKQSAMLIQNRFRTYFYERDLFAFEAPLKKDMYFFGRRDMVHNLVNRYFSGEVSAVFGLRKTGKTSILYGIDRVIDREGGATVWVDCQRLHFKRWNTALFYIIRELKEKYKIALNYKEFDYTEKMAPDFFEKELNEIVRKLKKPILMFFDEIENITFDISISEHWKIGVDFVKFWQVIRSLFQKNPDLFTYIIAGTNPMCFERITINGVDNPIYRQVGTDNFIEQFDVSLTKDMVNKLGGYMGIQFDDYVCASLTQDFGGHPFLIRHVCSTINKYVNRNPELEKPLLINKTIYDVIQPTFVENLGDRYCDLMLTVLRDYYQDEYTLLEKLSIGDIEYFNENITKYPEIASHLIGYGIIEKTGNLYGFKIDILKKYLAKKNKFKKINQSNEEKQQEINLRRNLIEPKLRRIVQNQLKFGFGETKAMEILLKKYSEKKKKRYENLDYKDLFNPNKHEIFYNDLINIMSKYWEGYFREIFNTDVEKFKARMNIINELRTGDCHAGKISNPDMTSFRGAMEWLEEKVFDYFEV